MLNVIYNLWSYRHQKKLIYLHLLIGFNLLYWFLDDQIKINEDINKFWSDENKTEFIREPDYNLVLNSFKFLMCYAFIILIGRFAFISIVWIQTNLNVLKGDDLYNTPLTIRLYSAELICLFVFFYFIT